MNKLSLKKLSILGLVLTAASAVTAAIVPKDEAKVFNGKLQASTGAAGQLTCVPDQFNFNCTVTANSGTTGGVGTSALNNGSSAIINSSKSPN